MAVRRKKVEEEAPKPKDPLVTGKEVMKLIDSVAEEKRIPRETLFVGLEQGIQLAALRHFNVEEGVHVMVDRATGEISAKHGEVFLDPETRLGIGRGRQAAIEIVLQILHVLQPHREPQRPVTDAQARALLRADAHVRRGRRVRDEALRVTDQETGMGGADQETSWMLVFQDIIDSAAVV